MENIEKFKSSLSAEEIEKRLKTPVPTKTSELENDSGFLTEEFYQATVSDNNIVIYLHTQVKDGLEFAFRTPTDSSKTSGLILYYPENENTASKAFVFADAHGNNVGDIDHLFAENVVINVILDVTTGMAFVQNADTNAYLEGRFAKIEDEIQNIGIPGGSTDGAVLYNAEQNLAEAEKAQARENIGAAAIGSIGSIAVTDDGNGNVTIW